MSFQFSKFTASALIRLSGFALPLILVFLAQISLAQAERNVDLYTVDQLVTGDGVTERRSKAQSGLTIVYQRVTGQSNVLDQYPSLRANLKEAERYLQTFSYRNSKKGSADSRGKGETILSLSYTPSSVLSQLRQVGAPFWSSKRPETRLVLLSRDGAQSTDPAPENLRDTATVIAKRLGLPVELADHPSNDYRGSSAERLWRASKTELMSLARESRSEAVLIGRLKQPGGSRWTADWVFTWKGLSFQDTVQGNTSKEVLEAGLSQAQKQFAGRLANRLSNASSRALSGVTRKISIDGLASVEDYFALRRFLQGQLQLQGFTISEFNGDSAMISVRTDLSVNAIAGLFNSEKKAA